MDWEEYIKILEENKDKSVRELEEIFGKSKSWCHALRKFADATDEEKEELAQQHAQYLKFYELYTEYKKKQEEKQKEEENKPDLEKIIKYLTTELKECRKLKEDLIKENAEDALEINRLRNALNNKEQEVIKLQQTLETGKKALYALNILIIIISLYIYV